MKLAPYTLALALTIALTPANPLMAQNTSQTENQNPLGSETLEDTTKTGGVHPAGTPGIEISNPTQYGEDRSTPPLLTAEAGEEDFQSRLPLLGLFGLLGLWGYFRKPVDKGDII